LDRGAPADADGRRRLRDAALEAAVRGHWWRAVATVVRNVGDLQLAEDAVQEACLLALRQWPVDGVPANPGGWLAGVARHKAIDALRREARRPHKEHEARLRATPPPPRDDEHIG